MTRLSPWIRKKYVDGYKSEEDWRKSKQGGPQMNFFGGGPLQALIDRIKAGNEKMWERWILIRMMAEGTGKDKLLDGWDRARVKLDSLVEELIKGGYTQCLYQDEKPAHVCLACPVVCIRDQCQISYFNRRDEEAITEMADYAKGPTWEGFPCDGCEGSPWRPKECPAWDIELLGLET